jgi:hypothetical protein
MLVDGNTEKPFPNLPFAGFARDADTFINLQGQTL